METDKDYMYNSDTEVLFPSRVISSLRGLRGGEWKELTDRVSALPEDHPEHLAFILMMVRLGGCVSCNADSFRAMRGCTQCARQTVRRFRGTDQDLVDQFHEAQADVEKFLQKRA
jgi:radical SAM superfamily enzyme